MRIPAQVILWVLQIGMTSNYVEMVCCCAMMAFAYIFKCSSSRLSHVISDHVEVPENGGIQAMFTHQKGRLKSYPLLLSCPMNFDWPRTISIQPSNLIAKCLQIRPSDDCLLHVPGSKHSWILMFGIAMSGLFGKLAVEPQPGFYCVSHNLRIGILMSSLIFNFPAPG